MVFVIFGEKHHVHLNKQLSIVLQIQIYLPHPTTNFFKFIIKNFRINKVIFKHNIFYSKIYNLFNTRVIPDRQIHILRLLNNCLIIINKETRQYNMKSDKKK